MPLDIKFITRVLSHTEFYSDDVDIDLVNAEKNKIKERYSELKRNHDYTTSYELARTEWLTNYMKENKCLD